MATDANGGNGDVHESTWDPAGESSYSSIDRAAEMKSLQRVLDAYAGYSISASMEVRRWEKAIQALRSHQKDMLPHLPAKYAQIRRCIRTNQVFINEMIQAFECPLGPEEPPACPGDSAHHDCPAAALACHASSSDGRNKRKGDVDIPGPEQVDGWHPPHSPHSFQRQRDDDVSGSAAEVAARSDDRGVVKDPCDSCTPSLPAPQNASHQEFREGRHWFTPTEGYEAPPQDAEKVRCMLRSLVRDWTSEGAEEREQTYGPILAEVRRLYEELRAPNRPPPRCLVPGAGLGRLAFEIAQAGFVCEGNEFSYYTLVCSSFVLNCFEAEEEWALHPWVHSTCNVGRDEDQVRMVRVPDVLPVPNTIPHGFSMCAGDFLEVYSHPSQAGVWDCVVTCFFIDTAHNVADYIEVIAKALKEGGTWINLGPLLWHFASNQDSHSHSVEEEVSIELSLEDVKRLASGYGFRVEAERVVNTTYTANCRSMMKNWYACAMWTMKKEYANDRCTETMQA